MTEEQFITCPACKEQELYMTESKDGHLISRSNIQPKYNQHGEVVGATTTIIWCNEEVPEELILKEFLCYKCGIRIQDENALLAELRRQFKKKPDQTLRARNATQENTEE